MREESESELGVTETFRLQVYKGVSDIFPHFNRLDPLHQRIICTRLEPVETYEAHNIAQRELLTYFVDKINPNGSAANDFVADEIAFGNDASQPSTTDGQLFGEFASQTVGSITDADTALETTTAIGENTLNGNEFAEVGLRDSATGTLLNRANIGPRIKNSGEVFTIDVNIEFIPF